MKSNPWRAPRRKLRAKTDAEYRAVGVRIRMNRALDDTSKVLNMSLMAVALAATMLFSGCKEADVAIDFMVGLSRPQLLASSPASPFWALLPRKHVWEERTPSRYKVSNIEQTMPDPHPEQRYSASDPVRGDPQAVQSGRTNTMGSAAATQDPFPGPQKTSTKEDLSFPRDPFSPPAEELRPEECPPSMPLCKFDRKDLTLRGLIQIGNGQFKGLVEDPDGRGYFVTSGTQIRGATVTQISRKGVTLYLHKSKKIEWMLLEGRQAKD